MKVLRSRSKTPDRFPIDQVNLVTGYLDHSNIYGSRESVTGSLRSGVNGKLKMDVDNILAPSPTGGWVTGDIRFSQTPQLACFHSLFVRDHNRMADKLKQINPHWTDQRLFEETRRINIAQFQHIVFEEYLPTFFNSEFLALMEVPLPQAIRGSTTYNEFNHAGFRVMHRLIPSVLESRSPSNTITKRPLKSVIGQVGLLRTEYDDVLRGMLWQPVNTANFDPELLHGLFPTSPTDPGSDLLSTDYERGREHGLPPYVKFLGVPVTTFEGLAPFMSDTNIDLLKKVYRSVEDVDILTGVLLEKPLHGHLFGVASNLMAARQFMRNKQGDYRFYTNLNPLLNPKPFTLAQLNEIKKVTTSHIFCLNSGIKYVPRDHVYAPTSAADVVPCEDLEHMDLGKWKTFF